MLMDELNLSSQERGSGLQQFHGVDGVSAQGREEGDLYGRDAGEHSPDHPGREPDVCQEPRSLQHRLLQIHQGPGGCQHGKHFVLGRYRQLFVVPVCDWCIPLVELSWFLQKLEER